MVPVIMDQPYFIIKPDYLSKVGVETIRVTLLFR
jgi:hypothetical protein